MIISVGSKASSSLESDAFSEAKAEGSWARRKKTAKALVLIGLTILRAVVLPG
jgi:hypothetical protein